MVRVFRRLAAPRNRAPNTIEMSSIASTFATTYRGSPENVLLRQRPLQRMTKENTKAAFFMHIVCHI